MEENSNFNKAGCVPQSENFKQHVKMIEPNCEMDIVEPNDDSAVSKIIASLKKYDSNISMSILGEAGPITSSQYPVGKIFIAISNNDKTQVTEHKLNGNRAEIIERASNKAIWELIKFIKSLY